MAATYRKVSRLIPSAERHQTITSVVAGDRVDIKAILGRPAKRLKIVPAASANVIQIRLNNKITIPSYYQTGSFYPNSGLESPNAVEVVSSGAQHPVYTLTGQSEYFTEENLSISYIDIEAITFTGGGTSITLYCW